MQVRASSLLSVRFALSDSFSCRYLHCVQPASGKVFIWSLYGFQRIASLRVDWLHKNAILQDITGEEVIPFIDVHCPIKELDIRGVQYPSPMMIKALTNPFQHLVKLKLDLVRVWCGLCHTVTFVRLPNSAPKSFLYKGGIGLPVSRSLTFSVIKRLKDVYRFTTLVHYLPITLLKKFS